MSVYSLFRRISKILQEKQSNKLKCFLGISLIAIYLIYNFFVIGKYSSYPWWYDHGNDADVPFAVTAISLLNNGDLAWLQHPMATFNSINTFLLRIVSFIPGYDLLRNIKDITSIYQAFDLIEKTVYLGRIEALIITILYAWQFFCLINKFLRNYFISTLFTFYLTTSNGFLLHSYWIRTEVPSLMFVMAIIFICINLFYGQKTSLKYRSSYFILIGLISGVAILNKIQVLSPIAVIILSLLVLYLLYVPRHEFSADSDKGTTYSLMLSILNILIFPWWTLKRPIKFPLGFCGAMNPADGMRLINKLTPDNYYIFAAIPLVAMLIFSIVLIMYEKIKRIRQFTDLLYPVTLFINCFILGAAISIYLDLIPALQSLSQYIKNTNVLIYTTLTNIFHGSFYQQGTAVTFPIVYKKIIQLHGSQNQLAGFNIAYIVIIVALWCWFRIATVSKQEKKDYLLVLIFICTGFLMDSSACFYLRNKPIYNYYAVFSLSFFILGLSRWISLEIKQIDLTSRKNKLSKAMAFTLVLLLVLNVVSVSNAFMKKPKSDKIILQSPLQACIWLYTWGQPFIVQVNESISNKQLAGLNLKEQSLLKASTDKWQALSEIKKGVSLLSTAKGDIIQIKKAMVAFQTAIKLDPREISGYTLLGKTYMSVGANQEAIITLQAALVEFPNNGLLHYLIAKSYQGLGEKGLAIANIKNSIEIYKKEKDVQGLIVSELLLNELL